MFPCLDLANGARSPFRGAPWCAARTSATLPALPMRSALYPFHGSDWHYSQLRPLGPIKMGPLASHGGDTSTLSGETRGKLLTWQNFSVTCKNVQVVKLPREYQPYRCVG